MLYQRNWMIIPLAYLVLLYICLIQTTDASQEKGKKDVAKDKPKVTSESTVHVSPNFNSSSTSSSYSFSSGSSHSYSNNDTTGTGQPNQGFNFPLQQPGGFSQQNPGFGNMQQRVQFGPPPQQIGFPPGFGGFQGPNQGFMGGNFYGR